MRLLILTQIVDKNDLYLGFFHRWVEKLAAHYEHIHVICLKEGIHALPSNVSVHSLGKSKVKGLEKLKYVFNFYKHIWRERSNYDAVFVHMNQEYVLLGGLLWKILGKRIYMWRNHYAGTWLTNLAVILSDKVFCTSQFSYTARFKKTQLMPVGVDIDLFHPLENVVRKPRSILFYARMSPSKHPDILMEALGILKKKNIDFSAHFYGTALPKDVQYVESLKKQVHDLDLEDTVSFSPGVPHGEGPCIFSSHEIFVNLGGSGMYDKMLFEAAASGCLTLAASKDFAREIGDPRLSFAENDTHDLAEKLTALLALSPSECEAITKKTSALVFRNDLSSLAHHLVLAIKS